MFLNATDTKICSKASDNIKIHLGGDLEVIGKGMTITPRNEVVAHYGVA